MSGEYKTDVSGNNAPINEDLIEVITESKTLSYEDSGKTILIATDSLVVTLPATKAGVEYTIVNSGADGGNIITVSPNADDAIFGSVANAAADSVAGGTADTDFINTKATANKGDYIKLKGDGADGWFIVGGVGIWADEA